MWLWMLPEDHAYLHERAASIAIFQSDTKHPNRFSEGRTDDYGFWSSAGRGEPMQ